VGVCDMCAHVSIPNPNAMFKRKIKDERTVFAAMQYCFHVKAFDKRVIEDGIWSDEAEMTKVVCEVLETHNDRFKVEGNVDFKHELLRVIQSKLALIDTEMVNEVFVPRVCLCDESRVSVL